MMLPSNGCDEYPPNGGGCSEYSGGDSVGLHPLPTLMTGFTPSARSILWLRMLALSQLCTGLLETQGQALDLEVQSINLEAMLFLTNDKPIYDEMSKYLGAVGKFKSALVVRPTEN